MGSEFDYFGKSTLFETVQNCEKREATPELPRLVGPRLGVRRRPPGAYTRYRFSST